MTDVEFAEPAEGRRFSARRLVRLSDCGPDGWLRPDGLARYLQDVATDDWDDTGIESTETWLVRRTTFRVVDGASWPRLGDDVTLTTWCSGSGAAWAERRTDLARDGHVTIQTVALWVPVGQSGRPVRVGATFYSVYGEGARRRIPGRIERFEPGPNAERRPWPLRRSDLDVVGHVNNASLWSALVEVVAEPVRYGSVAHHGSVESGDEVTLVSEHDRWWLTVDQLVRVAGEFRR